MANQMFDQALELTLSFEGGYSDHPLDPGGATNFGITRATLERHRGRPVAKSEVMALTKAEAAIIYRADYWNAVAGDTLPEGVDISLFDLAVNSGPARTLKIAQEALGLRVNGVMTAETLARIAAADHRALVRAIARRRLTFLQRLAIFSTFGRGWTRRVNAIESASLAAIRTDPTLTTPQATKPIEETTMTDTKSILQSRTVWANLIGLAALALSRFGYSIGEEDQAKLLDAALQTVAAASFIVSSVFRVLASRKIA